MVFKIEQIKWRMFRNLSHYIFGRNGRILLLFSVLTSFMLIFSHAFYVTLFALYHCIISAFYSCSYFVMII
jgi:hypothetical protein